MNNALAMDQHFERNKNIKAATVTLFACAAIFLLFFLLKFALPQLPPPEINEGIEVNLGDSETGLGDTQPLIAGDPAPADAASNAATTAAAQQNTNNETETNPDAVNPPTSTTKTNANNTPTTNPTKTVAPPTPPAPKAKAQMGKVKGGDGTGGNRQDGFDKTKNQGIAGGNGDQGNINGNPNSDSYKGNASKGNSGFTVRSGLGGRKPINKLSFEDDFTENAKVAVDITVDAAGNVINKNINLTGTTTTNNNIRAIALRKAAQIKFNAGSEESVGTILFTFKVNG